MNPTDKSKTIEKILHYYLQGALPHFKKEKHRELVIYFFAKLWKNIVDSEFRPREENLAKNDILIYVQYSGGTLISAHMRTYKFFCVSTSLDFIFPENEIL